MSYSTLDSQLLNEAYSTQLLKENFPQMTLSQVVSNLDEFNQSELEWVGQFSERVIENLFPDELVLEFFGGAKSLAKGISGGISKAGKGLAQKGRDVASGAARGVKGAAGQVKQNVKDMYASGEDQAKYTAGAKKAQEMALELSELIKSAQEKGLVTFSGDPMTMPLGELVDELMLAQKGSSQRAGSAQRAGTFKGAGEALKKGFRGQ